MSDIRPPDTTPEFMYGAWASCLSWAAGHKEILERFEKDTGIKYFHAKTKIEMMIDESTGFKHDVAMKFVDWFNENVWGDPFEVPEETK